MDFTHVAHVDLYCERTGPEFWSEPTNALTNLAFVAAGVWGVYTVRRRRAGTFSEVLAWWVVVIGIGSALFHTFANAVTIWFDILPIAGFTLAYTLFNLRRFVGMPWGKALAIFVGFYVVVGAITALVPAWLREASNGTTGYLPPFLALIFFGILVVRAGSPAGWYNIAAACIFVGSVVCRVIDPLVCESFPLGTHFLWHLLNGLMLGVLLAAVARYGAPPKENPRAHLAPAG
ncbi:ceramidase domain-containing protein [Mesorhizobium sp. LHD-90]|uniref:ceramidase domain-containing protein n=1 Tax=Mesorhizobium sp. LHD-90 TaxID=3071414 RepID=UPI0027DF8FC0|nr:ceramidase domain-containing protein [Mesorhizobium sp. LHD-90]MDQ6437050.1 ceramidase domain-containing protein [Mesorhizobium sp. LHD-90]